MIKFRLISLIILQLILLELSYKTDLSAQPDDYDMVNDMHKFFLTSNFNTTGYTGWRVAVTFLPVFINNFTDYDLNYIKQEPNIKYYTYFPKQIKSKSTQCGYIYKNLELNMTNMVSPIRDMWVQYKFDNSYQTPFVCHILCRPKDIDYTLQRFNGIQTALRIARMFIGSIPEVGGVIRMLIGATNTVLSVVNWINYGKYFYFLAYPYSTEVKEVPNIFWYPNNLGQTSTNSVYLHGGVSKIDTAFVTENLVVWDSDSLNYPSKLGVGYIGPKIVVNIYPSWQYFLIHPMVMAEAVKNTEEYNQNPKLKKLVDFLIDKNENDLEKLYSEIGFDKAKSTSFFLDEHFAETLQVSSPDYITKLDELIKAYKLE